MSNSYLVIGGSADITPRAAIALAGYAKVRKAVYDRVVDPLEANVVVLRQGGFAVAFISLDLMYVGSVLRERIVQGLSARLPAECIFLSASHTHFGPPTEPSLPILGAVSPDYIDFVASQVTRLCHDLLDSASAPASVDYLEGETAHSINRRRRVFGIGRKFPFIGSRIQIKPNIAGPRDDVVRLIRIRGEGGAILALMWAFACHPVMYPHLNELTAEYPGAIRSMLRARFGDIPIVFWQGFSGNIRPRVPAGAANPTFGSLNDAQWSEWTRSLGERVGDTAAGNGLTLGGPISSALRFLDVRDLGLSSDKRLSLHEVRLGEQVTICGLSAEVAVEYVDVFQRLLAPSKVIPVGCVGDVFGYLPATSMIAEGGYEVDGFVPRFGLEGSFKKKVTDIVSERLIRPFR